jgi:type VI secretion system secreted protein VgrG
MAEMIRIFQFHSDAVADDTFNVAALRGVEEMSTPYELEIDLVSKKADVSLEKMLTNKAHLAIRQSVPVAGGKRGARTYKLHGIVSEIEVLEKVQDWVKYRVKLVPRLWKLSLTTQSRVFQEMDVKEVVKQVLQAAGLSSSDFEFKTSGSYPKREFVVQYNETDLDFVHRWLEHEGIFYFFDQTESGEKIVFADAASAYAKLPGDPKIPYRPTPEGRSRASGAESEETLQEESVHAWRCRYRKTTKQVVLKDYNYRTPSVELKGQGDVQNPAGEGKLFVYGEHFKTPAEGNAIAKVRAEEIQCRDKVFDGKSDHRSFRPGIAFNLSDHFRSEFNASYAVTSVRHQMSQGTEASAGAGGAMAYQNEFTCIPADDTFRPERRTPWPSIYGFMNARVDAGGDGQYAEIDDQGRYKVKLPFDLSDKKDGKASRFIRMAQPYSGANMGMHFPLHKNTEVLLGFVDGDVDRPIIASSIPNAETVGPVTSGNQSQCAIQTGGGNKIFIEDTSGNERIKMSTPRSKTFFQLGSPNADGDGITAGTDMDITFDSARDYVHTTGRNVTIETAGNEHKITKGDTSEETHGNKREWTKGDSYEETIGNSTSKTIGNSDEQVTGNQKSVVVGSTDETFTGTKTSKAMSAENEMTLAAKNSMSASAENETKVGAASSIFGGIQFESTNGLSTEASKGGKVTLCEARELKTAAQKLEEVLGPNEIKGGTITIDATTELDVEGGTSITIKCGAAEIKLSPAEIVIKAPTVKIDASAMGEFKSGGVAKIQGSALDVSGQALHK